MPSGNPVQQTQANQQQNYAQSKQDFQSAMDQALMGEKRLPMDPAMKWSIAGAPGGSLMKGAPTMGGGMTTGAPAGGAAQSMSNLQNMLGKYDSGLSRPPGGPGPGKKSGKLG